MKKLLLTILMTVIVASVSTANENNVVENHTSTTIVANKTNPFCMAIVKGDFDTVKKLIELGSDVNEYSAGMTPLMYAARYNKVDIIKLLIENGAKIKAKNKKGYTAMKFAEISNAKDAMALLKELP